MTRAVRWEVEGAVQGVGFRPSVVRLARDLGLSGWVANRPGGAVVEARGEDTALDALEAGLRSLPQPIAVDTIARTSPTTAPSGDFVARESLARGTGGWALRPDLVTCDDCLREVLASRGRRAGYPFTSCPRCGPSASVARALPWDRPRTTMATFTMCEACRAEYDDPGDRRFHAELNCCPACGPTLSMSIADAAAIVDDGGLLAIKALGGYQVICDPARPQAVARLRAVKDRPEQPFALLVTDVDAARMLATISDEEAALLSSPEGPIVLLDGDDALVGLMLPTTPLHHLLVRALDRPLICTSANRSGEPTPIDAPAVDVDAILDHDRPIARRLDDSVTRVAEHRPLLLRRARGYAPGPVAALPGSGSAALGAHLKVAVAVHHEGQVHVGAHLGDLGTRRSREQALADLDDLTSLLGADVTRVACDLHPDAGATHLAAQLPAPTTRVPHHRAHALSVLLEHDIDGPATVAVFDGLGWGEDDTLWGGELFDSATGRRYHLKGFPLVGGEAALRSPRRQAEGLLAAYDLGPMPPGRSLITSAAGRWFDAVAALCGCAEQVTYEAQAAQALEALARPGAAPYPFTLDDEGVVAPSLEALLGDLPDGRRVASRFHATLAAIVVEVARRVGHPTVALTGGCFANRLLLESAAQGLRADGREVVWPERLPPGDGGLGLGQLGWLSEVT
jgi:hydrogenase maturation protein HypF